MREAFWKPGFSVGIQGHAGCARLGFEIRYLRTPVAMVANERRFRIIIVAQQSSDARTGPGP
jgi:hypothetical protein